MANMKRRTRLLILTGLLALILVASAVLASPAAVELSRYVIGGGGGYSQAAPYELNGTIGQPVVGTQVSSPYELCSGFWCGMGEYKIFMPTIMR